MSTEGRTPGAPPGYVDAREWPGELVARVVTPAAPHRIHGYAVAADLARHETVAAWLALALTGELPASERRRPLEAALALAAPVPIQRAATHAARLAHVCGAPSSSVLATAAVALAEAARVELDEHAPWLDWLAGAEGPAPDVALAAEPGDAAAVDALLAATAAPVRGLERGISQRAAVLATLRACGLVERWQLETALVVARLGVVVAEAVAVERGALGAHPMNLPRFEYVESSPREPAE
ncbi:MAG: hypothetical protein IT376_15740 [Polyangiaceae bacterium]|nr:hypothetical protein [Polyangiaceae bacterium]